MSKIFSTYIDGKPDIFIISPFTSVVFDTRKAIKKYAYDNQDSPLNNAENLNLWLNNNIGTVHKFQGKEAKEVIFVLGCDMTLKDNYAVKGFVNSNIVNVAVTRAKYRLYIVGDKKVWQNNRYISDVIGIIESKGTDPNDS